MSLVPKNVSRTAYRQALHAKKNSPHIFFMGGLAGVVASTVLACRATLNLDKVVDELRNDIENVKGMEEESDREYHDKEYHKDLAYVYGKGSYNIARLYAPAATLGVVSIACLTGSHISLNRRNQALTAALATMTAAYEEYRQRVSDELGADRERNINMSTHDELITNKDGEKELIKVADQNGRSPYARFFDEYSPNWQKNAELNRLFVQCQQNYANNLLQARGHVFLNEVYDMLGIERSRAGSVVGWVISDYGDNYIDFGMFEVYSRDFVNGQERSILLDFNVDGVI